MASAAHQDSQKDDTRTLDRQQKPTTKTSAERVDNHHRTRDTQETS